MMSYREQPAIEKAIEELFSSATDAYIVMGGSRTDDSGKYLDYFVVKNRLMNALSLYSQLKETKKNE